MSGFGVDAASLVGRMAVAVRGYQSLPELPASLSMDDAYAIQRLLADAMSPGGCAGFKSGLTAPAVQHRLGISHPVIGRLYEGRAFRPGQALASRPGMILECEIGVRCGDDGVPLSVQPVVEIVFLQFADTAAITAPHVVAANLGADSFICGRPVAWHPDLDDTAIEVFRDGQSILSASLRDSLGGPASGARWMVEQAALRGFSRDAGTLMILGTCGTPLPAVAGSYRVDYGEIGSITFDVT